MKNVILLLVFILLSVVPALAIDLGEADLDGDGYLSVDDLRILGTERSTLTGVWRGDVTGDGRVDDADVSALARLLLAGAGKRQPDTVVINELIESVTGRAPGQSPGSAGRNPDSGGGGGSRGTTASVSEETRQILQNLERNRERLSVRNLTTLIQRINPGSTGNPGAPGTDPCSSTPGSRPYGTGNGSGSGPLSGGGGSGSRSGSGGSRGISGGPGSSPGAGSGGRAFTSARPGKGKEAAFPDDLRKYMDRLGIVSELASKLADGFVATVEEINARRNRNMSTSPTGKLEEIFNSAVGQSLNQVAPSEYPDDRLIRDENDQVPGLSGTVRISSASDISRGVFYPRSGYELAIDKGRPENPEVTSRVPSWTPKEMNEVYQPVSATEAEEAETSPLLENEVKDLTDDPYMAQLMKDLDSVPTFIGAVGDTRKGLADRASSLLPLFDEPAREPMIRGDGSQFGLSNDSPYVKDYVDMAEELLPKLAETGAISQGEATQTVQEIKQLEQAILNPPVMAGGGGGDGGGDSFSDLLGAILDPAGITPLNPSGPMGGSPLGSSSGSSGGSSGTSSGGGLVNVPIPTPRPSLPSDPPSGTSSGSGAFGCFAAGTPVLVDLDGTTRPIEELQVGDTVLGFDGFGSLEKHLVTKVFVHPDNEVLDLNGILVTGVHRFFTGDGSYQAIGEIAPGTSLVAADGTPVREWVCQPVPGRQTVYNLTVEGVHTYVAGGFRVHNIK